MNSLDVYHTSGGANVPADLSKKHICRNCRSPFIERTPGQKYCRKPACILAEQEELSKKKPYNYKGGKKSAGAKSHRYPKADNAHVHAKEIYSMHIDEHMTQAEIAKEYGVNESTIWKIISGEKARREGIYEFRYPR